MSTQFATYTPEIVSHIPMQRLYRLRWRFAFADKKDRVGIWDDNGPSIKENSAWAVDKRGLTKVFIDCESLIDYTSKTLVECDAQDFALFQWRFISYVNFGNTAQRPIPAGLQMLTRDKKITVYVDGRIDIEDLNEDERGFHFTEYQAGSLIQ